MSTQLRLDVAQLTDVGRKRPHNEDNMAYVIPKDEQAMARKGALFIVADGMGGHAAGEVASEIAVDTVTKAYYEDEDEDIPLSLINAIKRANSIIHQRADENSLRSGMGTTCVAAVLCGNMAYIANVGDSRAYIVRQTQVRQISEDHSWVEEQVRAGLLTHDQARSHAQRNVITRCLGTQTDVEVDVFPERLSEGDTLILCTDGLSGSVGEEDLYTIINQFVPQESVYRLVERANENGGPDNITAIVTRVIEVGADVPLARYPVPAGSRQADVDTTVLSPVSTSSLGFSSRAEDGSKWSSALEPATGPMSALSSNSPPSSEMASLVRPVRRRLFYPTIGLIVLVIVIVFGGGAYYLRSVNNSANQLSNARSFIERANGEATQNPVDALQQLSLAQNTLLSTQQGPFIGDQVTQYKTLQTSLSKTLQTVVGAYNRKELITQLSCKNMSNSVPINTALQPVSLSTLQDGNGMLFSYVLANDNSLYQLMDQKQLGDRHQFADNARVWFLTGSGQHLFALTSPSGQSGDPPNYSVNMLSLNDQPPALKEELAPVDPDLLKQGWVPTLLTSYGNDVYAILTTRTIAHKALLLHYDATDWQKPAHQVSIPLMPDIVSVAAFPGKQLFLLTSDGHIKGLQYPDEPNNNSLLPDDVSLKNPIAPPLANDGKSADLGVPIVPESSLLGISAKSGVTLLVAGTVGDNTHLYVVDPSNHRIMDLEFIAGKPVSVPQTTPTATSMTPSVSPTPSTGAVIPPSLKVMHQFASKSVLSSVKSATVGANGKQLYLLTQSGGTLTTISSIDKAPSC